MLILADPKLHLQQYSEEFFDLMTMQLHGLKLKCISEIFSFHFSLHFQNPLHKKEVLQIENQSNGRININ